jgi:cytochrome c-type biogenesis protein CcmH/NrfG
MSEKNSVSKSTLYVAVGISLIAGFLGGVVYTIYNAPAPVTTTANMQQQAQAPPLSAKIARLEQESKKHPDDPAVWESLGHAYFDSNLTAQAIQAYNKSLELRPQNPNLLTDLGVMYRRNSQPEKAVAAFDKALSQEPQHQQAMFNKGVVMLNDLHDPDGAVAVWEHLIQLNPEVTIPTGASLKELVEKIKNQTSRKKP